MGKIAVTTLWDLTQLVKEEMCINTIESYVSSQFVGYNYNVYKTKKDEVLQIFNDEECITVVGGSSWDKLEWRSNFNVRPLWSDLIHEGYYHSALEVTENNNFIERDKMLFDGLSRGGAIASVICFLNRQWQGVGFGSPKPFKRGVNVDFVNYRNILDPITKLIPSFVPCGEIRNKCFLRRAHTGYGEHIGSEEFVEW